ncbi:MAG TPA: tRNA lysidine(34) synthetase TilS [Pseudolabrys sp.]|nr:tRNA lysidine(34) synthetase TilS [Pseudolabrys sp.]
MRTAEAKAVSASEATSLFSGLQSLPVLVLAVSGGPDSTALMVLAARWRDSLKTKPKLIAVTVDHGLRKESKAEAAAVARLARELDIAHRTSRWTGRKPKTGLQEAARLTRYRLLGRAARKAGGTHILTAHTLDDQSETVLIRMSRGSGLSGLGAMQRISVAPQNEELTVVRPFLEIPKARLIATLNAAGILYADDPSNRDPRFTRARLRGLMHLLAEEGLDAAQLARLAHRLKRADIAIEKAVERAVTELFVELPGAPAIAIESQRFADLPAEVALRLLGRAVARVGDEGPVELGKLEALKTALDEAQKSPKNPFRRTLAGAIVTLKDPQILVDRAPPRRRKVLTKRRPGRPNSAKRR